LEHELELELEVDILENFWENTRSKKAKAMGFLVSSLNDWIRAQPLFGAAALSGSLLFVVQFLLSFLGGGGEDGLDESCSTDSGNLKWLSKQALTGFLMMFGWVGLTCRVEYQLPVWASVCAACLGGFMALFATALLFKVARKLRSPGFVFNLEDAIGKQAVVYQRIPKRGVGKISLTLHELSYEIDAISLEEEIPSFAAVQILKTSDEKTVVVVPIP